jgi:hypothetical protein
MSAGSFVPSGGTTMRLVPSFLAEVTESGGAGGVDASWWDTEPAARRAIWAAVRLSVLL